MYADAQCLQPKSLHNQVMYKTQKTVIAPSKHTLLALDASGTAQLACYSQDLVHKSLQYVLALVDLVCLLQFCLFDAGSSQQAHDLILNAATEVLQWLHKLCTVPTLRQLIGSKMLQTDSSEESSNFCASNHPAHTHITLAMSCLFAAAPSKSTLNKCHVNRRTQHLFTYSLRHEVHDYPSIRRW